MKRRAPDQVPSARRLAGLLTITRHGLMKAEAVGVGRTVTGVLALAEARSLASGLLAMVRERRRAALVH